MLAVDFARLHPVMDKPLYATHDLTPEETIFQTVYLSFDKTIGLTRIIRQSSDIRLWNSLNELRDVPFSTAVVADTFTAPGPGPSPVTNQASQRISIDRCFNHP